MPQVDHLTFYSQAFWGLFFFLNFFFFFSKWGINLIKTNISVRFLNILKKKEFIKLAFLYTFFYNIQISCKSLVVYNFVKTYLKKNLFFFNCWSLIWLLKGKNDIKNFYSFPKISHIKNQVFGILILLNI